MRDSSPAGSPGLKKNLKLLDVYAISTGAMFSSGFFLLPGLAFGLSGAWVILAYLLSAVLVVPAMLSKAELASAMPRAGGTYYFLDRSMGPVVGTVGGLGTWVAMGLKNTFALIGMGAYLTLVIDVEIEQVAVALTVFFTVFNIVGAKETAGLQRVLVFALVGILGVFCLFGLGELFASGIVDATELRFAETGQTDADGVLATIGLVFVSYAGLTKAVSVAEEVENPDRNLVRGMVLSLATAALIYVVGTYLLVMFIPAADLATDLTPVATAADAVFDGLPAHIGLYVILVAAVAAFASTANAGILAASRYLFAMGRDRLISPRFARVGRFRTPTLGVLATAAFVIVAILTLDVLTVAKLASAFQLLMFALVNVAVIVMRESRLESYDPAFRSPLYPWTQILGIFFSFGLIIEMGKLPMLFTLLLVAVCVSWFFLYAKARVVRRGAILHWFERLGRGRFDALDSELREILREKGLRVGDPYGPIVAAAPILDLPTGSSFECVVRAAASEFRVLSILEEDKVVAEFLAGTRTGATLIDSGVALPHFRAAGLDRAMLVVARVRGGVDIDVGEDHLSGKRILTAHAFFFLISPDGDPGQHLRILAKLASVVCADPEFIGSWNEAADVDAIRALLEDAVPVLSEV